MRRTPGLVLRSVLLVGVTFAVGCLAVLVVWRLIPQRDSASSDQGRQPDPERIAELSSRLSAEGSGADPVRMDEAGAREKMSFTHMAAERGFVEIPDEQGRVIRRYEWTDLEPLPGGWSSFTEPTVRLELGDDLLLVISAARGQALWLDEEFREGELLESVRLAVYRDQPVRGFDADAAEPIATLETEALSFDVTHLTIRTDEAILVRTEEAALAGTGLFVDYSDARSRVEDLQVYSDVRILARRNVKSQDESPATREPREPGEPRPRSDDPRARDYLYYRLTLGNGVTLMTGEATELWTATAMTLNADFAIDSDAPLLTREKQPMLADYASAERRGMAFEAGTFAELLLSAAVAQPGSASFPMVLVGPQEILPDDVRIESSGPMRLSPYDARPETLANANDRYLELLGAPARIEGHSGGAEAATIAYSDARQTATFVPGADLPVVITLLDEESGAATMRAKSEQPAFADLTERTFAFTGAGTAEETRAPQPDRAPSVVGESAGLPAGALLRWVQDAKFFFFAPEGLMPGDVGAPEGFGPLRQAVFRGDVRFDDPEGYWAEAEMLTAQFEATPDGDRSRLSQLIGDGDARAAGSAGLLAGNELAVIFRADPEDPTRPIADFLEATGEASASNETSRLDSDYIRATFAERSTGDEPDALGLSGGLEVATVNASGRVRLRDTGGLLATGDRLEADPREETAVLTGESVTVQNETALAVTTRVELNGVDRTATIPTSGQIFHFQLPQGRERNPITTGDEILDEFERRLDEDAVQEESPEPLPGEDVEGAAALEIMKISWQDHFVWRDAESIADFHGNVLMDASTRPELLDHLEADRLTVYLTKPADDDEEIAEADLSEPTPVQDAAPESLLDSKKLGSRRINFVSAVGSTESPAALKSVRFTDATRQAHEMIAFVNGPIIEYSPLTEIMRTIGDGSMLVADYRPDEPAQPGQEEDGAAALGGRGETLFTWSGQLTLDAIRGAMEIRDDVTVRHRATGSGETSRLNCNTLTASLDRGVNVGGLQGERAVAAELRAADAVGDVIFISSEKRVFADRMHYDRKVLLATLEADAGNRVTVEWLDSGQSRSAGRVVWDLYRDSIRVEEVSGG